MEGKYYLNQKTGEVTEDHAQAMDWYRNDQTVEVIKNGKTICILHGLFGD